MLNKKTTRTLCLILALLAMLIGVGSALPRMARATPAVLTSINLAADAYGGDRLGSKAKTSNL